MHFTAENAIDYMNFRCAECSGDIVTTFLGFDPAQPKFRFECLGCKQAGEYKMQFQLWKGLPSG